VTTGEYPRKLTVDAAGSRTFISCLDGVYVMDIACDSVTSTVHTITFGGVPTSDRIGKSLALPANAALYGITEVTTKQRGKKKTALRTYRNPLPVEWPR